MSTTEFRELCERLRKDGTFAEIEREILLGLDCIPHLSHRLPHTPYATATTLRRVYERNNIPRPEHRPSKSEAFRARRPDQYEELELLRSIEGVSLLKAARTSGYSVPLIAALRKKHGDRGTYAPDAHKEEVAREMVEKGIGGIAMFKRNRELGFPVSRDAYSTWKKEYLDRHFPVTYRKKVVRSLAAAMRRAGTATPARRDCERIAARVYDERGRRVHASIIRAWWKELNEDQRGWIDLSSAALEEELLKLLERGPQGITAMSEQLSPITTSRIRRALNRQIEAGAVRRLGHATSAFYVLSLTPLSSIKSPIARDQELVDSGLSEAQERELLRSVAGLRLDDAARESGHTRWLIKRLRTKYGDKGSRYPAEFRENIARHLVESGISAGKMLAERVVPPEGRRKPTTTSLYNWKRVYLDTHFPPRYRWQIVDELKAQLKVEGRDAPSSVDIFRLAQRALRERGRRVHPSIVQGWWEDLGRF